MNLLSEPLLTTVMPPDALRCEPSAIYLHSHGSEERSHLDPRWVRSREDVQFEQIVELPDENVELFGKQLSLRDQKGLVTALAGTPAIYIDITGMTYSTWAPILVASLKCDCVTRVVYREPLDYTRHTHPTRGLIYDLSEKIAGIAPLPGLANLRLRPPDESVFVPLLGFEGARLAHVLESSEPSIERVVPIIGTPGFRPEYAAQALLSGRITLQQHYHHSRIQFAKANCPFDLFHELVKIHDAFDRSFLRIAPVGTKPHGLGAVLFALGRQGSAEIVYDHPIRKRQRTSGRSQVCLYDVSEFAESDLFHGTGTYA